MRILPIYYGSTRTTFGTTPIYSELKEAKFSKVKHTTWLLRPDVNWFFLAGFMDDHFKSKDKVHIYNLACSDGSEPYTLAIAINEVVPENRRNKFFPIIASDKEKKMIELAKSGVITLENADIANLKAKTNNPNKYFIPNDYYCPPSGTSNKSAKYKVSDELKNAVRFENCDALSQLEKIKDKGNTVILCRNATLYFTDAYLNKVIRHFNNLKKGSMVVLGKLDDSKTLRDNMERNFTQVSNNIYVKN